MWFRVSSANSFIEIRENFADVLQVFCKQFVVDYFNVADRVNFAFLVHDFFVLKCTNNVVNSIYKLDVRQESIAKSFAFASALDETRDVPDRNTGSDFAFRLVHFA